MTIRVAAELSFSPPPRCPKCGTGLLPYGTHEPFAVDVDGRAYCRDHSPEVDAAYPRAYEEWKMGLKTQRLAAIRELDEELAPPGE